MSNLIARSALLVALGSSLIGGCVISSTDDATLEVINQSDFIIDDLFITDVNSSSWGTDLLGNGELFPNESIVIGLQCGYYDVLVVDETGAECEVNDIDLCLNDAQWILRNNTCPVFSVTNRETGDVVEHQSHPVGEAAAASL